MARIQWHGSTFLAEPKEQLPNGDWLMVMKEHGPRFTIGTLVRVTQKQVVEMAAAEMPDTPNAGLAALETGLAAERKEITPVGEMLSRARAKEPAP